MRGEPGACDTEVTQEGRRMGRVRRGWVGPWSGGVGVTVGVTVGLVSGEVWGADWPEVMAAFISGGRSFVLGVRPEIHRCCNNPALGTQPGCS